MKDVLKVYCIECSIVVARFDPERRVHNGEVFHAPCLEKFLKDCRERVQRIYAENCIAKES